MKRIIAFLLALVCCAGVFAACGETDLPTEETVMGYITPDMDGKRLEVYVPKTTEYELEGSYIDTTVEKYLNVELAYIEASSASTVKEMNAQGKNPDLVWTSGYNHKSWGIFGDEKYEAFINIYDILEEMPNVKAFLTDPANAELLRKYTYAEGKLYAIPTVKTGAADIYAYLYRQDIFEKHNLTFPTNQEEFVAVLRKLKELYPDSQPFIMRSMKKNIQAAQNYGHLWGASHQSQTSSGVAFTLDAEGNYYLAPVSQAYKEIAMFWKELMDEGLMNKSSVKADTDGWYAAFRADMSFITYDKVDRLPLMNENGKMDNPDFQVVAGAPFNMGSYAETTDVVSTSFEGGLTSCAFMIGNGENVGEVIAYVDWLYSPEGQKMTSWGKEGESYEVAKDGTKSFKEGFIDAQGGWTGAGLGASSVYGIFDFEAYKAACEPYLAESITLAEQFKEKTTRQPVLVFTEDEDLMYITYAAGMYNYACGEWYKFVCGQRDFAEWDQVLDRCKKVYGYDILLELHQTAYERLKQEEQ